MAYAAGVKGDGGLIMKKIPYGYHSIRSEDIEAVRDVLGSDFITQGPKVAEFEKALCDYTGAKYAVAVSSGTAALHIAALASGIVRGDELITSPITFAASANCALYCQARPVFADIEEDTGNIDAGGIEGLITAKTKVIVPVHFSGQMCDMEKIYEMASRRGIVVIEDAAHALGAAYKKSKAGACKYSDMTILSFHPVKHITTGEGGAVLTNSKNFYEKLLMLRNHGITKDEGKLINKEKEPFCGAWYYEMQFLGFNYRITDFQCSLGISQLGKIDSFVNKRRAIADTYDRELGKIEGIDIPARRPYSDSSWHLYFIRVKNPGIRKKLFEHLHSSGIGAQVHYLPVYLHPYYSAMGFKKGLCPKAEDFYGREISIPMYPALKGSEIRRVVKVVSDFFKKKI